MGIQGMQMGPLYLRFSVLCVHVLRSCFPGARVGGVSLYLQGLEVQDHMGSSQGRMSTGNRRLVARQNPRNIGMGSCQNVIATLLIGVAIVGLFGVATLWVASCVSRLRQGRGVHIIDILVCRSSSSDQEFVTSPAVLLIGTIGICLILLALGLHLRFSSRWGPPGIGTTETDGSGEAVDIRDPGHQRPH
jgi:hypothetical protein